MEIVRTLEAPGPAERLFPYLDDLEAYRRWMPLVHAVTSVEAVGDLPAWDVELRATVGPFARSKRLRMVRTDRVEPELVVFERAEVDGRAHAPWIMRATVAPDTTADASSDQVILTMSLHYGGSLWTGAALQRVLDHGVDRGGRNLVELLSSGPTR